MLELRPICENCARPLPPDSPEARICSFDPASTERLHRPVDPARHARLVAEVGDVPPTER